MNERIAHLYQVAIQDTMDYHDENPKVKQKELDNFCATRFSELIVNDVLDLCKKQKWHSAFNEYREGIRDTMKSIKEHFGVE